MESKKEQRKERKRKKLLAEYELARSNDSMKRPGQLLDSAEAKRMKGEDNSPSPSAKSESSKQGIPRTEMNRLKKQLDERKQKILEFEELKSKLQFKTIPTKAQSQESRNELPPPTNGAARAETKRLDPKEFKLMKKQLAERKKILQQFPRFLLQDAGLNASLDRSSLERAPILMCDVQHLLLYTLCGNNGINQPQRWCVVQKHNNITHMVVLILEGLTSNDFLLNEHLFPKLTHHFENRVEVFAPSHYGSGVSQELASVPLSIGQKNRILEKFGTLEAAVSSKEVFKVFRSLFQIRIPKPDINPTEVPVLRTNEIPKLPPGDMFSRMHLILTPSQMISENFPLKLQDKYAGYTNTREEYNEVSQFSPMFAIDCEMCMTEVRSELTRISVVNEQLEVVYESLVKPKSKIVNYLTKFSGITKELLEDVTTTLEDVQQAIQKFLPDDAILVGHSLNCDLQAMEMIHPYVIDTSTIFNMSGYRGRKSKLSHLSEYLLKEDIQKGKAGHCPTEDATAAMKLVKLKLSKGFSFGDYSLSQDESNAPVSECQLTTSIFSHTRKGDKTVALVGSESILDTYKSYAPGENNSAVFVPIDGDDHKGTIAALKDAAVNHNFALAHLNLSRKLEKRKKSSNPNKIERLLKKVDSWCEDVYNHVSLNGFCLILFSGPTNTKTLVEQKYATDADDSFTLNNNDNSLNGNESSIESSQQEINAKIDTNPRQANGVCFITLNSPKKPR